MEDVYEYLSGLPEDKKKLFVPIFGNVDRFYSVVYLITRSGHVMKRDKPYLWAERLRVIRQVEKKVEKLLNSFHLNGREIVADIANVYFNDHAKCEELEPDLTDDEFLSIIRRISLFA